MYLKSKEKKRYKKKVLTTSLINTYTPPNKKYLFPVLTLPLRLWLLSYPKLLPFFVTNDKGQVTQAVIMSLLEELASSSSSSSTSSESPLSPSSSNSSGEGERDATKPQRRACHRAIRPIWVFTWHNSSLSVSRQASMRWSCTMTALKVTPPTKEEGADVDGAKNAGGVAISVHGRFDRS